jgi:ferredoxin--NADP+ reductase
VLSGTPESLGRAVKEGKAMNRIVKKVELAPEIELFEIEAPSVARKVLPGHFVVVRTHETGERIPLTIADVRKDEGILVLVVQEIGKSTKQMGLMQEGDSLLDVAGPLGKPSHIDNFGTVVCVGGGVGIAPVFPITRALKEAGNTTISIVGARTEELLILEDWMRSVSDELWVTTDDGSHGTKGFVSDELKRLIDAGVTIDRVIAIGPTVMMKAVSEATRPHSIPTVVSLNPIMVDGTGMCGACRVEVGGETRFACVDGPEFDGHLVDYELLLARQHIYHSEEMESVKCYEREPIDVEAN